MYFGLMCLGLLFHSLFGWQVCMCRIMTEGNIIEYCLSLGVTWGKLELTKKDDLGVTWESFGGLLVSFGIIWNAFGLIRLRNPGCFCIG